MNRTPEQIEYRRKRTESQCRYRATPAGREMHRSAQERYRNSEKGKAAIRAYRAEMRVAMKAYQSMKADIEQTEAT